MKILITGGSGMLGHQLLRRYLQKFDVWTTVKGSRDEFAKYRLIEPGKVFGDVDVTDFSVLRKIIKKLKPDVIVNAVGVIKQRDDINKADEVLKINAGLPHQLAAAANESGSRLICVSTDCVFNGSRGYYTETDVPDAADLYGRSKLYGEVYGENCLTVRTSIIGRELKSRNGLCEWFLGQRGKVVKGFNKAVFSGFTTIRLAEILAEIIERRAPFEGLYHLASEPINKYDLLNLIKKRLDFEIEIEEDAEYQIDRSLDGGRYNRKFDFTPPDWERMIDELARDNDFYERRGDFKG